MSSARPPPVAYKAWAAKLEAAFAAFVDAAPDAVHAAEDLGLAYSQWAKQCIEPYAKLLGVLSSCPSERWIRDEMGSTSAWLQTQMKAPPSGAHFAYVSGPLGSFAWFLLNHTKTMTEAEARVARRLLREFKRSDWENRYNHADPPLGPCAVVGARVLHTLKTAGTDAKQASSGAAPREKRLGVGLIPDERPGIKRPRLEAVLNDAVAAAGVALAVDSGSPLVQPKSRASPFPGLPTPGAASRRPMVDDFDDDGDFGLDLFSGDVFAVDSFCTPITATWTNCMYMLATEKGIATRMLYSLPGHDASRFGKFKTKPCTSLVAHFLAHGARNNCVMITWGPLNIWAACIPLKQGLGPPRGVFCLASQPRGADSCVVSSGTSETLVVAAPDQSAKAATLHGIMNSDAPRFVIKEQNGSYTLAVTKGKCVVPMTYPLADHTASKTKRMKIAPKTPNGGPHLDPAAVGPEGMCPVGEVHSKWRSYIREMLFRCLPFYTVQGRSGFLYTFECPPDASVPWPTVKRHALLSVLFCGGELATEVAWVCPSYPMLPRLGGIDLTSPVDEQAIKAIRNWSDFQQHPPVHWVITAMPTYEPGPDKHLAVELLWSSGHGFRTDRVHNSAECHLLLPTGIVCDVEKSTVTTGTGPLFRYTATHVAKCRLIYCCCQNRLQLSIYYALNKQSGKSQMPIATLFSGPVSRWNQALEMKLLNGTEVSCKPPSGGGAADDFEPISPVGICWDGRGIFVAKMGAEKIAILESKPHYSASVRSFHIKVNVLASVVDPALVTSMSGADIVAASAQAFGSFWCMVLVERIASPHPQATTDFAVILASKTREHPEGSICRYEAPDPDAGWSMKTAPSNPVKSFSVDAGALPADFRARLGRQQVQTMVHLDWVVAANRQQSAESYLSEPTALVEKPGKTVCARVTLGTHQYESRGFSLE